MNPSLQTAAHMPPSSTPFSVRPLHFQDPKLIALKSGQFPPVGGAAVVVASNFAGFSWVQYLNGSKFSSGSDIGFCK